MKKILIALSLIMAPMSAYAVTAVWVSSNTATADTTKNLCFPRSGIGARALFHGARINTGAAGTLTIYASSGTAASPIAAINTAALASLDYDVAVSTGLTYSQTGTANITLLYQCY